jgi:hypothetical protein
MLISLSLVLVLKMVSSLWFGSIFLTELAYLLNLWSGILREKLTGSQLVKKFLAFYETRSVITALRSAPSTCSYPEPDQSSTCPFVPFPEDPF